MRRRGERETASRFQRRVSGNNSGSRVVLYDSKTANAFCSSLLLLRPSLPASREKEAKDASMFYRAICEILCQKRYPRRHDGGIMKPVSQQRHQERKEAFCTVAAVPVSSNQRTGSCVALASVDSCSPTRVRFSPTRRTDCSAIASRLRVCLSDLEARGAERETAATSRSCRSVAIRWHQVCVCACLTSSCESEIRCMNCCSLAQRRTFHPFSRCKGGLVRGMYKQIWIAICLCFSRA